MKKLGRTIGAIALGTILLSGCGDGQADVLPGVEPAGIGGSQAGSGTGSQVGDGMESQAGDGTGNPAGSGTGGSGQSNERVKLTLGCVGSSRVLEYAVDDYNTQGGEYYVEIVDYLSEGGDSATYEAAYDKFRMDLATGKGADIIEFGSLDADGLGYAGVVMDLNIFLTLEEKQGKYLGNILECAKTGKALYEISPEFILEFIVGDGSRIGMENGWTMEEMLKSFEKCGRDGRLLQ